MFNKFIVFSDIHFYKNISKSYIKSNGISSWFDTQVQIVNDIFDFAKENGINTIIHNGDLLEEKSRIPQDLYNAVWELFRNYSKDFRIIFNSGNHDLLTLSRQSSLKPFSDIVEVVVQPKDFKFEDTFIRIIPFGMVGDNLDATSLNYKHKILFLHEDIDSLIYGYNDFKSKSRLKMEYLSSWDIVFNGHIHKPQDIGNIINIGSPMLQDWGEAEEVKRFIIFDKGKITHIKTKCPKFIEVQSISDIHSIKEDNYNYYRINVNSSELSNPIFKKYNVTYKLSKNKEKVARMESTLSEEDKLKWYIKEKGGHLDLDKLLQIGINLTEEV